jgi:hypothetical protein
MERIHDFLRDLGTAGITKLTLYRLMGPYEGVRLGPEFLELLLPEEYESQG